MGFVQDFLERCGVLEIEELAGDALERVERDGLLAVEMIEDAPRDLGVARMTGPFPRLFEDGPTFSERALGVEHGFQVLGGRGALDVASEIALNHYMNRILVGGPAGDGMVVAVYKGDRFDIITQFVVTRSRSFHDAPSFLCGGPMPHVATS